MNIATENKILSTLTTKATKIEAIFDTLGWNTETRDALVALSRAGRVVLYRNDDTRSVTRGDETASRFLGLAAPRHLAYLR